MNRPKDFEVARDEGWYRIPEKHAPRGMFFEYVAFYFTGAFGEEKWAVHYYARCAGHELVTRRTLLPDEPDHPRADELYYKMQLGPLQRREPPITSQRWRRIAFIHTTWDRFEAAEEINDLFVEGGEFVDRLYHALREAGMAAERRYPVRDAGVEYIVDLALPCREGILVVDIVDRDSGLPGSLRFSVEQIGEDPGACLASIRAEVHWRGGILPRVPGGRASGT
ncbi:MAG: hypothetical protein M8467_05815 [Anaerolineae bacterium]|nr:hypothetical protein [Anaerolineae bacterium]